MDGQLDYLPYLLYLFFWITSLTVCFLGCYGLAWVCTVIIDKFPVSRVKRIRKQKLKQILNKHKV